MKHIKSWFLFCAIVISTGLVAAQIKLGPKDATDLPPSDLNRVKVGDQAPDFTLENIDGKPISLSDYRGKKTVVLVFYRGYW